jgi:hypothetical protein
MNSAGLAWGDKWILASMGRDGFPLALPCIEAGLIIQEVEYSINTTAGAQQRIVASSTE